MKQIAIIGGGASGLAAALSAARTDPKAEITVLEGLDRVGKKILATGNGRCNLTNSDLANAHYHSSQPKLLGNFLAEMPTERTLDFFRSLGLWCAEEELGRIYPNARQASAVLDVLLNGLEHSGVRVECGVKVKSAARTERGFRLTAEDGRAFYADAVVLAAGGRAAPKQGTDGAGFALARQLGHSYRPPFPCLVPLKCAEPVLKGLKGVRAHGTVVLTRDGTELGRENGEIQFTDYGLSGIPIFQLSCLLGRESAGAELTVDLLPERTPEELMQELRRQAKQSRADVLERFLPGLIHKKLLYALMKQAGLSPLSRKVSSVREQELRVLAECMKAWRFHVTGTQGWEQAQVTGGGVPLDEVNADLSSKCCPGLYLAGEVLDVVGDCGGYNLHWAWCTGLTAGEAAAGQT